MASIAFVGLADGYLSLNDTNQAIDCAEQACQIAEQSAGDLEIGLAFRALGEIQSRLGKWLESQQAFERSQPALAAAQEESELARAQLGYELASQQLGDQQGEIA